MNIMFLDKDYGLNDYNMPILPYRMMGSYEYTETDIINLTEEKIIILNDIFIKNNKETFIQKIMTNGKTYRIDYNEKKLIEEPETYADYMKVDIYKVYNEYGKAIVDNYLNIYSFNDGKYGADIHYMKQSKSSVCEDFDGLLKYLYDLKFTIL